MELIPLDENSVELQDVRVRDRREKPTDQWSDNGIGRGLVTNSPTLGTRPNRIEIKIKDSYSFS
jgi:hypothetical protein